MRTIGRRLPRDYPPGEYKWPCDVCGGHYRRSKLIRKSDGLLYCPDDVDGRTAFELSEAEAMYSDRPGRGDGGGWP